MTLLKHKHLLWVFVGAGVLGVGALLALVLKGPLPLTALFAKDEPKVAIVVNKDLIYTAEFEQAYLDFLNRYRASLSREERLDFERSLIGAPGAYYQLTLKSQVAEDLIRRALLKQAAQRLGSEVPQEEVLQGVRQQVRLFLEQNGVSAEQIQRDLEDPKTYKSAFTLDLRTQIYWQMLEDRLRERIAGRLNPTEAELQEYYQQYQLRYYVPELAHVQHILIKVSEQASAQTVEAAHRKIEQLADQLKRGADFNALARQYSEDDRTAPSGGDYGWIQTGDPAGEAFVNAAFALELGEVSAPVLTKQGFHLIQLLEHRPARGETFDDVAQDVRRDYILEKTLDRYRRWYEGYRAEADVRIELPLLAAYRLEAQDREAALHAYEKIRAQGLVADPYLGYYIARLYHAELDESQQTLAQLQDKGAQQGEITQLQARIDTLRTKIVENLKDILARGRGEEEVFQAILQLTPEDAETRFAFARFLQGQGRWHEAAEQLKRVVEDQPGNIEALRTYGQLLLKMNDFKGAAEYLAQALVASGSDRTKERLELQLQLVQAYHKLGRLEEARQLLQRVLQVDPKNFQANRQLGVLDLEQGDYSNAIQYLRIALENISAQDKAEIEVLLGQAYLNHGDLEPAEQLFQKALEAPASPVDAYRGLGELSEKRGDVGQALRYYQQGLAHAVGWGHKEQLATLILKLNPGDSEAHLTLAELYHNSHRYEEAVKEYRAILELQPDSVSAWRSLGDTYLDLQRYPEAVKAFQEALLRTATPEEQAGLWARILSADRAQSAPSKAGVPQTGIP